MDNNEMLEQEEMKAESLPEQVKPPKKKMSFGKNIAYKTSIHYNVIKFPKTENSHGYGRNVIA